MHPLEHKSVGFRFQSDLPILTLRGVGLQRVETHSYCWNNHHRRDEHCLIQFCLEGEGAVVVDDIRYPVRPGEAFLVDIPGDSCYFLPQYATHWEFFYFEFSKECLPLMRKIYGYAGPVVQVGLDTPLAGQMEALYRAGVENRMVTLYENSRLAYGLWMELMECALAGPREERSRVDAAKAYIDQHYAEESLNLDQIAQHIGVSKYHLCKEFHRKFGTTPGKYIGEVRIAKACALLLTNRECTMEEIAHRVGYRNNNYFGKVFRAKKGLPPDQYKRQSSHYDIVRTVYEFPKQSVAEEPLRAKSPTAGAAPPETPR